MKNQMTAAEIAALKIDGLPASKAGVRTLAEREGWPYEEKKGVGGTRRLYSLPERYLAGTSYVAPPIAKVAGFVAAGRLSLDGTKLATALRALEEWEKSRGVTIATERKAAVITILYDYLEAAEEGEGEEAMAKVLKALG